MSRITLFLMLSAALALSGCKKEDPSGEGDDTAKGPDETKPDETKPDDANPDEAKKMDEPAGDETATDLTQVAIPNASSPMPNVLIGGQPSDDNLAKAKEMGIKTVVNLRSDGEKADYETEEAKAKELGLEYVHIPVVGKTGEGLNAENAKKVAEILDKGEPVMLHCKSGQRVAAMMGAKAHYVDGKSAEEAMKAAKDVGLTHEGLTKVLSELLAKK